MDAVLLLQILPAIFVLAGSTTPAARPPAKAVAVDAKAGEFVTVKKTDEWQEAEVTVLTRAVRFRNLQPDDEHDFALLGPKGTVLAYLKLPALSESSYEFTFHRPGLFDFKCLMHQPGMSGQILVLAK